MQIDPLQIVNWIKELGGLGLLALLLLKGIPELISALGDVKRVLYRIEGKLGLTDSDQIPAQKAPPS